MFKDITMEELLKKASDESLTLIDVRSPGEYKEATIPGSINIPIFSDEERAEVGTIYKQVGPEAAKKKGLEIFSKKLPKFVDAFRRIDTPKTVFCWRGGMRSKTAATVLDLMGIKVTRLQGGIRAYRKRVVNYLDSTEFKPELIVLNGNTGCGKTYILHELKKHGHPAIDLEGMAGHRGSIFGHIGDSPNNQRKFDALLFQDMLHYQNSPYVFIEGESKRIGKVVLPEKLHKKKEQGMQLIIRLPIGERVKNILHDYEPWKYKEKFIEAFLIIKKRIHTPAAKQIETELKNENFEEAVRLLLKYYYDPLYKHTGDKYSNKVYIDAENAAAAVKEIEKRLPELVKS